MNKKTIYHTNIDNIKFNMTIFYWKIVLRLSSYLVRACDKISITR